VSPYHSMATFYSFTTTASWCRYYVNHSTVIRRFWAILMVFCKLWKHDFLQNESKEFTVRKNITSHNWGMILPRYLYLLMSVLLSWKSYCHASPGSWVRIHSQTKQGVWDLFCLWTQDLRLVEPSLFQLSHTNITLLLLILKTSRIAHQKCSSLREQHIQTIRWGLSRKSRLKISMGTFR